jgi:hypothetical protein
MILMPIQDYGYLCTLPPHFKIGKVGDFVSLFVRPATLVVSFDPTFFPVGYVHVLGCFERTGDRRIRRHGSKTDHVSEYLVRLI